MQKFLKSTTISAFAILLAGSATAQVPTNGLPNLFACRSIENDLERVECYDKVTDALQAADRKGEIVTITKKQVEKMEEESFGFNLPSLPKLSALFGRSKSTSSIDENKSSKKPEKMVKKPAANNLISTVKSIQVFNRGLTRFYLENGQVWEQKDGRKLRLRIRKDRPIIAHIKLGSLSGYRLRVNGKGEMIVVRRVQ